jgi:glycosyltransferase involved in cell wall biosynthesis
MTDQSTPDLDRRITAARADAGTPSVSGPRILLLGPARTAVSGVSTHLNQLFESTLAARFCLMQFQVGSEGRAQGRVGTLLRLVTSPFAFAGCLIRARPQIVHINTSLEPKSYWRDVVYLALAKVMKCRVIYQVHGGALPAEFFAGNRVLTALLRRVVSWPDMVVLLAHTEMAAYGQFAPHAHLVRIVNAITAIEAEPPAERYTAARPLEVVYVGRLAADKGVFETIEAVKILRDRGVTVRVTLAGSGPAGPEIRRAIGAARLGDRARLVGAVFGPAKQHLWQQADVLAFPTYHREGLPYALLEAMAAGTVPVISPVGAIPDVVQHEVHGLFVPAHDPHSVADALQRLAKDRVLLYRLALAARARVVEHYSVARMAQEFEALYTSLATDGPRGS